ncbi:MAG: hypothetical protein ACLQPI_05360, partial [Limisphaerales bacterium]
VKKQKLFGFLPKAATPVLKRSNFVIYQFNFQGYGFVLLNEQLAAKTENRILAVANSCVATACHRLFAHRSGGADFSAPPDLFSGENPRRLGGSGSSGTRIRSVEKSCRPDYRLEISRRLITSCERFDNSRQCRLCH